MLVLIFKARGKNCENIHFFFPSVKLFKIGTRPGGEYWGEMGNIERWSRKRVAVKKVFKERVGLFSLKERYLHRDLMTIFELTQK